LGDGDVAGREALLDRADDVDADATPHAVLMERPEVRAIADFVRRDPALLAVARDPQDPPPRDLARQDRAARQAVRRMGRRSRDGLEPERRRATADDLPELAVHAPRSVSADPTAIIFGHAHQ